MLLLVGMMSCAGFGQQAGKGEAEVRFQFEREGVPVPRFTLTVRESGEGSYQAEEAGRGPQPVEAQRSERSLVLDPEVVQKIFAAAHELHGFDVACASKAKNIADTGMKTLSYKGPDGAGSCVYNFSENKVVVMLTDLFAGIAYTMDEGRKLAFQHRFDRLGLDAELETLAQAVQEKRACEVRTISPVLESIAVDTELMQRARVRASRLLEMAKQGR